VLEDEDGYENPTFGIKRYSGKKCCINKLLQACLDMWDNDNNDKIANIGMRRFYGKKKTASVNFVKKA